jgi:cytochrome c oxidase cbb3-type subunit II
MFRFLRDHGVIERNLILMGVLTLITVSLGGLAQIVPLFAVETTIERVEGIRPYTPLELAGRNIYVREGCYLCHSQQVRPFRDEAKRYGNYSLAAESMYDHPFQWGSKRTGPDLARVGGKYSDDWQAAHLRSPRSVVPESIMPPYAFLDRPLDYADMENHLRAQRTLGTPYSEDMIANARADVLAQKADAEGAGFTGRYARARQGTFDGNAEQVTEMDALVAYLQMLGTLVQFRDVTPEQVRQQ